VCAYQLLATLLGSLLVRKLMLHEALGAWGSPTKALGALERLRGGSVSLAGLGS